MNVALVVALVSLVASSAFSQTLTLQFAGGRVTLEADGVSTAQILDHWARVGGVTIINGDKVTDAPTSVRLVDVAEREALATLLRSTGGYMLASRRAGTPGAAVIDRILILPVSTAPASARAPSSAFVPSAVDAFEPPVGVAEEALEPASPTPPQAGRQLRAASTVAGPFAPSSRPDGGAVVPVAEAAINPASGRGVASLGTAALPVSGPMAAGSNGLPPSTQSPAASPAGRQNIPANPFGVTTGSSRPGTISPVPEPAYKGPPPNPEFLPRPLPPEDGPGTQESQ